MPDKGLHTKTGEDDGNPADGLRAGIFRWILPMNSTFGFESDTSRHDNEKFGELV